MVTISGVGTKSIFEGAFPYSSFLLDSRIWIPLSIHESKKCDKKTKKRDVFIAGFTTWCVIQLSRSKYCTTTQRNTPIANMAAYARKRGFSVTTVAKGRFTYSFSYTSASCLHFCSSYFFEDISRKVLFVRRYGLSIISQYF